jgi:hypothetical protein
MAAGWQGTKNQKNKNRSSAEAVAKEGCPETSGSVELPGSPTSAYK